MLLFNSKLCQLEGHTKSVILKNASLPEIEKAIAGD